MIRAAGKAGLPGVRPLPSLGLQVLALSWLLVAVATFLSLPFVLRVALVLAVLATGTAVFVQWQDPRGVREVLHVLLHRWRWLERVLFEMPLLDALQSPLAFRATALDALVLCTVQLDQEERQRMLHELPPSARRVLCARGVLSLLPRRLRRLLTRADRAALSASPFDVVSPSDHSDHSDHSSGYSDQSDQSSDQSDHSDHSDTWSTLAPITASVLRRRWRARLAALERGVARRVDGVVAPQRLLLTGGLLFLALRGASFLRRRSPTAAAALAAVSMVTAGATAVRKLRRKRDTVFVKQSLRRRDVAVVGGTSAGLLLLLLLVYRPLLRQRLLRLFVASRSTRLPA
ncbi:MAG: hypothetical protein MHM6MM_000172 [Cercozoa sp. M6MM]